MKTELDFFVKQLNQYKLPNLTLSSPAFELAKISNGLNPILKDIELYNGLTRDLLQPYRDIGASLAGLRSTHEDLISKSASSLASSMTIASLSYDLKGLSSLSQLAHNDINRMSKFVESNSIQNFLNSNSIRRMLDDTVATNLASIGTIVDEALRKWPTDLLDVVQESIDEDTLLEEILEDDAKSPSEKLKLLRELFQSLPLPSVGTIQCLLQLISIMVSIYIASISTKMDSSRPVAMRPFEAKKHLRQHSSDYQPLVTDNEIHAIIIADNLVMRDGPSRKSAPISVVPQLTPVKILVKGRKWTKIQWNVQNTGVTIEGWVFTRYLKSVNLQRLA